MMMRALLAMVVAACLFSTPASGEPWSGLFEERQALTDLGATDATLRAEAASWLGRWGRAEVVVPPLITALRSESRPLPAVEMVEALGRLNAVSSVPILVETAPHAAFELQATIIRTLGGLANADAQRALIEALPDPKLGPLASEALVRIGPSAIPLLLQSLTERPSPLGPRTLGRIGSPLATPELVQALEQASPNVRVASLEALGEIGDPRAGRAVRTLIDHASAPTRAAAIRALATLGDASDIALVESISQEALEPMRSAALTSLLALAPDRARAPLMRALVEEAEGPHAELRARALATPSPALIPLFGALIDADRGPLDAALALARIDDGLGLQALSQRATREDASGRACRVALALALRTNKGKLEPGVRQGSMALLRSIESTSERRLLRALARDADLVSELPAALRSEDAPERAAAGQAAELLADPRVADALSEALRGERDEEAFRRLASAAAALGAPFPIALLVRPASAETTAPEAMLLAAHQLEGAHPRSRRLAREFFRSGLRSRDPRVRAGAARALAVAGDRQAYRALLEIVEDDIPAVRRAGARALQMLAVPAAREALLARARIEREPHIHRALLDAARAPETRRLGRFAATGAQGAGRRPRSGGSDGAATVDVILGDGRWLRLRAGGEGDLLVFDLAAGERGSDPRARPSTP